MSARLLATALLTALMSGCSTTTPPDEPVLEQVATDQAKTDAAGSSHCHHEVPESPFEKSTASYAMPDLNLTDQQGRTFAVQDLNTGDKPVAVNFIFATCTTICPVMTATFSKMRHELGAEANQIRMVSITIDPEHDTPEVLAAYAAKHEAPDDWLFLTGPSPDVNTVLRAFDAFNGSKFNHQPITVLRAPGAEQWTRLDGLGSGAALADEVRTIMAKPTLQ